MKYMLSLITTKTKLKCLLAITMASISSVLASIWPVRLGELYTDIATGKYLSISQTFRAIAVFGFFYVSAEIITITRRVFMDCIISNHEAEIRELSIEKMLKRPVKSYFGGKLSGEQTAQLNQGVSGFSHLIKMTCNDIISTIFIAVCTLIQVLMNAPFVMVCIMLCYLVLSLAISIFQIRSQNGVREQIILCKNKLDGQVCQSITNIELIRCMNAEEFELKRLHPDILNVSATEKKHHTYMGFFDGLKQLCKITFQIILLLTSIYMIGTENIEAGTTITVCLLFQQLTKPIEEVYRFMDETAASLVKAKTLIEVTGEESDPVYNIQSTPKEFVSSDITLSDVIIENPEQTKKLAHYDNLHIPGGSIVAMKGESGCGKTTLMRCLNRFYTYTSGFIQLFGHNLDSYSQEDLTKNLFYIPQKSFFFSGTIRENLLYGLKRNVTDQEMLYALEQACLLNILPKKNPLDYSIGEGGNGLSGGEGQRLSIARAFLRSPKAYIFDESTAALDEITTEKVIGNINRHAKKLGSTVIYITHNINVMNICDYVIHLNNKLKTK